MSMCLHPYVFLNTRVKQLKGRSIWLFCVTVKKEKNNPDLIVGGWQFEPTFCFSLLTSNFFGYLSWLRQYRTGTFVLLKEIYYGETIFHSIFRRMAQFAPLPNMIRVKIRAPPPQEKILCLPFYGAYRCTQILRLLKNTTLMFYGHIRAWYLYYMVT